MALLDEHEIELRLEEFESWVYEDKSLVKEFSHKDFSSTLAFVVQVGVEAEKTNHHPDILIHSYNKSIIRISTHSEGGVTEKDFELVYKIEKI